jgi:hypothetical protein
VLGYLGGEVPAAVWLLIDTTETGIDSTDRADVFECGEVVDGADRYKGYDGATSALALLLSLQKRLGVKDG